MDSKKVALITSLMLFGFCSAVFSQNTYQIKGKVEGLTSDSVFLYKMESKQDMLVQSTKMNKGSFTFKGKVSSNEFFMVKIGKYRRAASYIFIDKGETRFTCKFNKEKESLESIVITGCKIQEEFDRYKKTKNSFYESMTPLQKEMQEGKDKLTDNQKNAIKAKIDSIYDAQDRFVVNSVKDASYSNLAPFIVLYELVNSSSIDELKGYYKSFSEPVKKTALAAELASFISKKEMVSEGAIVPNFKMATIDGKEFDLASFKGKVFVIDFWASWCGPCRKENPNMVKLYKAFHDKGLEMVGVSLDKTKEAWEKAVEKDGLTWTHVSDLKFWSNAVAEQFLVSSVPTTVLVDKDGKIVARGLHGEKLYKAVEALLQ